MRIAFIGAPGHHYLRGALTDNALSVAAVAVASDLRDVEAARRLSENLPGALRPQWFDDPARMLDEFKPDVVSVGAVYGRNGPMIALALERDIPVVSDKPIAGSWEMFARLEKLLAANPARTLLTEFDFHSQVEFRAARQAVRDGLLGEIVLATAQKSYQFRQSRPAWWAHRDDYTGTICWIASHGIDAIHFTTGKSFRRVFGMQGNLSRPDYGSMEDHAVCVFELDGGATGMVHADFLRPAAATGHGDDRLRLAGTRGMLEIRDGRCLVTTQDQPEIDITDSAARDLQPIHRELLAALRHERTDLYSTAQSLYLARVLLAARDAADGRRVVEIAK